jgi:hypothetical protein
MAENLPGLLEVAEVVDSLRPQRVAMAYSGRVFERHPELRQRIPGVFLGTDLRSAVALADELGEDLDPERWYSQSATFSRHHEDQQRHPGL